MASKQAVVITPRGDVFTIEYAKANEYDTLSDAVGGYIEMVSLKGTQLTMVLNEEGKLNGFPFNLNATMIFREKFGNVDTIVGNAVFIGAEKWLKEITNRFPVNA